MRFYRIESSTYVSDGFYLVGQPLMVADHGEIVTSYKLPQRLARQSVRYRLPVGLPRRVLLYLLERGRSGASSNEIHAACGEGQSLPTLRSMLNRHCDWFIGGSRGKPLPWRLTEAGRAEAEKLREGTR